MTKSTAADQGHPQPAEVRLGSLQGISQVKTAGFGSLSGRALRKHLPSRPHHSRTLGSEQHALSVQGVGTHTGFPSVPARQRGPCGALGGTSETDAGARSEPPRRDLQG